MNEIIRDLSRVVCHIDNILVLGRDKNKHDSWLHAVLKMLKAVGVTLNEERSVSFPELKFFFGACD